MAISTKADGSGDTVVCDGCGRTVEEGQDTGGWRASRDRTQHSCPDCLADDQTYLQPFGDVDSMTVDELEEHFGHEHRSRILSWLESALKRRQIQPLHDHPDRYELVDDLQFPLGVSAGL